MSHTKRQRESMYSGRRKSSTDCPNQPTNTVCTSTCSMSLNSVNVILLTRVVVVVVVVWLNARYVRI